MTTKNDSPEYLEARQNWWDKKDKYSRCPKCDKKGFYSTSLVDKNGLIHKWDSCMFCKGFVLRKDEA